MRKTYNVKLIIYLIAIAVIPVLIISCFVLFGTKQLMLSQIDEFSNTYLSQAINATDIVLKQVSDSCKQMAIDDVFAEFETFYKGAHYERLIEQMTFIEDLEGTRSYMESKSKLFKRMSALKLSNEFVESVYLLDVRKGTVYTDIGLQYNIEQFFDQEWLEYRQEEFISPEWMDTRWAKQSDGTSKQVMTLLISSYYHGENLIAVNLNAERLHRRVKSINNADKDLLIVLSQTGEIILGEKETHLDLTLEKGNELLDGERYSIHSKKSEYTGWEFVQGIHLEKYFAKISLLVVMVMIITGGCLIGGIGMAFWLRSRLYKPIQKLFKHLEIYKKEQEETKDEFDTIGELVCDIQGEKAVLEKKLAYSLPVYKEKYLQSLLLYENTTEEEIKKQLILLESTLTEGEWGLAILASGRTLKYKDILEVEEHKNKVCQAIQVAMGALSYECLTFEKDKFVVIFNKPEGGEIELFKGLERWSKIMKQEEVLTPCVAVSRWGNSWREMKEIFEQTDQFFKYLLINHKVGVSGIIEEQLGSEAPLVYPKDKLDLLSSYLRNGDLEATKKVFAQILNQWTSEDLAMCYAQAQLIYFEVLSCVLHTISLMGLELSKIYGSGRNLYQELTEQQTKHTLGKWFEELFERATSQISQEVVEHKNKHITYVIKLLEENCSEEISLEGISEQLGLNPNYLSRVFKEVTGKRFIDYLTQVRIEKSLELLAEGNLKIKEIAESVGYPNANYFIKLFKESQGITPGEYKKLYSNKKIE